MERLDAQWVDEITDDSSARLDHVAENLIGEAQIGTFWSPETDGFSHVCMSVMSGQSSE
jgi:hypothetical protein